MALASKVINQNGAIREFEKPEVCEAIKVANANKWIVGLSPTKWDKREARLKKEYEENTKAPGPGEAQTEDMSSSVPHAGLVYDQNFDVERLRQENKDLLKVVEKMKEGNPALKESATQFNDALLDEQAKKIARLKKIIRKKNKKIEELRKESSEHLAGEVKFFGETVDLSQELCDKNEELRLSKIREKNLVEVSQKYMKENEELKNELADKVVDKIDAQALKSAESALAWKEKVVTYKDMALAYYEKKINEKDEVIADLGNELAATKKELEAFKESYKRRIKEDSEHFEHIQKICNAGLQKWLIESEYLEKDKPFCSPQLPELSEEEEKRLSPFRDDSVGAVTNQKDCSPVKDNHPTEDNPEEVEVDEILERVRKDLEEDHTVSIDYDKAEEGGDRSATIVECGKDIDDVFEEIENMKK